VSLFLAGLFGGVIDTLAGIGMLPAIAIGWVLAIAVIWWIS